ncbi:septum formation initiator family protein [Mycolicibacterium sp. P1-18]|uniref:FtsB family cell division protein n=1 Tax=Mycolicibacterium sp. P1-18 TaxID=2024615 RepID=UPI0011F29CA6|nr:septum formation initiator family protein [Mycolicibacterium sp. P1-18]KAA0092735.1 septum formation initiator family protein [Mycolicibacterium sp. P1-18]
MPDAKRPDPKRRAPASRPGKGGGRPRGASPIRREPRAIEARPAPEAAPEVDGGDDGNEPTGVIEPIRKAIAEAAEQQSEQRLGSAARRAAILAVVVCVLTLTIAGPVRTYFAQRTEMKQLVDAEAQLRSQIADLEQQKLKLGDPVYIAAQARERLGFVMPGDIPYQVQLPPGAEPVEAPGVDPAKPPSGQPWYTSLWHTIADAPHGVTQIPVAPDAPAPGMPPPDVPPPPAPAPPGPGG